LRKPNVIFLTKFFSRTSHYINQVIRYSKQKHVYKTFEKYLILLFCFSFKMNTLFCIYGIKIHMSQNIEKIFKPFILIWSHFEFLQKTIFISFKTITNFLKLDLTHI